MDRHDPYGPMLAELSDVNEADTDELLRDCLRQSQEYVRNLRQAYRNSPSNVDFSCENTRAAYLLAYYPHYIEILYRILSSGPQNILNAFFDHEKLRACFLCAGPAPEVVGWIAYLEEFCPTVSSAVAYLLDKYSSQWHKGQEITRYHVAPNYWKKGKLVTCPLQFDLWDCEQEWSPRVVRAIQISSLFVMQNCLNDLLGRADDLLASFMRLFRAAQPGSLFILADLDFPAVRSLLSRIEDTVEKDGTGGVLRRAGEGLVRIQSKIILPDVIQDELLTGDNHLKPRRYTRFYYSVIFRMSDPEPENLDPF